MITRALVMLTVLVSAGTPPAASGQTQIANFASVAGMVEVQRGGKGDWQAATVGSAVYVADAVRTGAGAFAKLVFTDDAVVDLGPATAVAIEHYAGSKGPRRSLLRLTQGKLEALVSGYGADNARFEVETPTAVARAQATDFIVSYDAGPQATDVIGVEGVVAVRGTTGIIGPGVAVAANELTHVSLDGFPSPVKALDPAQAAAAAQGLRLVGTGGRDGLDVGNPIAEGQLVAASDRPGMTAAASAGEPYLRPGVPGQTLLYSLSPDMRANTQPLPVYRAVPPNAAPVPPH